MRLRLYLVLGTALGAVAFGAYAAPPPNISYSVGVCSFDTPKNCIKPNADGSINVNGGGGGGGASVTQRSSITAVTAGTNQPLYGDSASGAVLFEPVKPGTTTAIDLTAPSGVLGADGATIATTSNPFPTSINGTVPLPTGAATSALQTTGNTSLGSIVTNTTGLTVAQGSTTSGQTGQLVQGKVNSSATGEAYTTAQTDPLSLFTNGELRIGGGVADATTDSGLPVKVGGVYNSTAPTYTTGQRTTLQTNPKGAVYTNLEDLSGNILALGTPNADGKGGTVTTVGALTYGFVFNGTNWDRWRSIGGSFGATTGVPAVAEFGSSKNNITTATTTTVKSGAGVFHKLSFNTLVGGGTVTIYDNTTATGTKIGTWTLPATVTAIAPYSITLDAGFSTGLTVVTSAATDITVVYD